MTKPKTLRRYLGSDFPFNKLGHHRLCSQPTLYPSCSGDSQSCTGMTCTASLSCEAQDPQVVCHCDPGLTHTGQYPFCAGVAAGSHLLSFGTILQRVCTAPPKVPMRFNLLVILVACSMARPWIASLSQSLFMFPGTTSKKKSLSPLCSPEGTQAKTSTLCHLLKVAAKCIKWENDLFLFGKTL